MKFSIKNFFSKCETSLMENFIFRAVNLCIPCRPNHDFSWLKNYRSKFKTLKKDYECFFKRLIYAEPNWLPRVSVHMTTITFFSADAIKPLYFCVDTSLITLFTSFFLKTNCATAISYAFYLFSNPIQGNVPFHLQWKHQ